MNFDEAFTRLLGHEGGYSNHPDDPGGETMWGITIATARANGYNGPMRDLSVAVAKKIYRKSYWDAIHLDAAPADVRYDLFDASVNSGPGRAIEWLHEAEALGTGKPETLAARFNGVRLEAMTYMRWASFGKGWARRIAANLKEL